MIEAQDNYEEQQTTENDSAPSSEAVPSAAEPAVQPVPVALSPENTSNNPREQSPEEKQADAVADLEKGMSAFEKAMVRLTFFALIVAAGTGVLIWGQFKQLSYQNQILGAQTISSTAGGLMQDMSTRQQLAIAQKQAKAAQDSVAAIQRQMRQDQRAWLQISFEFSPEYGVGRTLTGTAHFVNIGKTPAKQLHGYFITKLIRNGENITFPYHNISGAEVDTGSLFPGKGGDTPTGLVHKGKTNAIVAPVILTREDVQDLREHRAFVITYGYIRYLDVFDIPHITLACSFSAAGGPASFTAKQCIEYNNVDNN